jgi:phosphate-selective porin OprO and OprP
MKKTMLVLALFLWVVFPRPAASADDGGMELLVEMLVENGVLSQEQAQVLASKAKEKAARKAKEKAARQTDADDSKGPSDNTVKTTWKNGLKFETPDLNFNARIGGRIHADMVYIRGQSALTDLIRPQGDFNRRNDRVLIRRARLYFEGTVYKDVFYKLEYDFSEGLNNNNEIEGFKGVYVGVENIPYAGKITVGHVKEPFGLERLTSSNDITFIERALPNVFAPGFSWGAAIDNNWFDKRVTFSLGAFRNSTGSGTMATGNEWNLTTRVTGLAWYAAKDKFAHLGASYSLRIPESANNDRVRFRQRPEIRTRDRFVNTGNFSVDLENRSGLEAAVVYGPLSLQGEFMQTWVKNPAGLSKTGYLFGAYGYVSYFLTGESRKYNKSAGDFSGVKPNENFSIENGTWGAWELAARYSHLDLDDKDAGITGGILNDITLGVNWYLNPIVRVMFNYVHSHRAGYGHANGVQGRVQVAF